MRAATILAAAALVAGGLVIAPVNPAAAAPDRTYAACAAVEGAAHRQSLAGRTWRSAAMRRDLTAAANRYKHRPIKNFAIRRALQNYQPLLNKPGLWNNNNHTLLRNCSHYSG